MESQLLKSREVCKIFSIHPNTFLNWIHSGKIKAVVINKQHYVSTREVERLKAEITEVK